MADSSVVTGFGHMNENAQYRISPESLHVLLNRRYDMFTDGRNIEKSYSLRRLQSENEIQNLEAKNSSLL